jgi:hypothetical protein
MRGLTGLHLINNAQRVIWLSRHDAVRARESIEAVRTGASFRYRIVLHRRFVAPDIRQNTMSAISIRPSLLSPLITNPSIPATAAIRAPAKHQTSAAGIAPARYGPAGAMRLSLSA